MTCSLRWLGHGGWEVRAAGKTILLDPFLDASPTAKCRASEIEADYILVSHGHFDHIADVPAIASRTGCAVICNYEISEWLRGTHRLSNLTGMNLGGSISLPFGELKMVPAWHSSQLPDGSYGGVPAGFILTISGKRYYFACDTALFSDMQLFRLPELHCAILPIGDLFTMGPADALLAIEWLRPQHVFPSHYGTWPPIQQDASAWAQKVRDLTQAQPHVPNVGETVEL
jgi:L-ascorbate metabolism protein UlaG (beta-lactamase superfamily)